MTVAAKPDATTGFRPGQAVLLWRAPEASRK